MTKQQKQIDKEFKLSSWAIANKTTIFVMISLILFLGISAYYSMPRESFPEIRETKIYVSSIYPGNTAEEVEKVMSEKGTTLVMINSVCGCSAGTARPGVLMAVNNATKKPDHITTSFAGFDVDAVKKVREYLMPYPPSSPSIALFKDGKLVHFLERHHIEGGSAQMISANLQAAYDEFC